MLRFISRHEKDYSRYNIIKNLLKDVEIDENIYFLLPFSKNQFIKHFFKRSKIINDFFISNYDTYVYDRKKISKYSPRAWWKYFQDWINFRYSKYLISDTSEHFKYWKSLFGTFKGKHFVLPVLADQNIYYPSKHPTNSKKMKILFYGSFIPLHGIDTILKAFKIVENENLQFEAHILGTGQIYQKMATLHEQLQLKNVHMNAKMIPETDLANEIRNADIVLGIFGTSAKAISVVPNKVYQALACKKPLITMETKATKEFFSNKDILFCENTEQSLAEAILKLAKDQGMREKLAEHGYLSFTNLYESSRRNLHHFIKEATKHES